MTKKKEYCPHCGQEVNEEVYRKNAIKNCKKWGVPSLAKLLKMKRHGNSTKGKSK
jgi:hypothetical protein